MNEPPANPRGWLFRVASNLCIDRPASQQPQPDPIRRPAATRSRAQCVKQRARSSRASRRRSAPRWS